MKVILLDINKHLVKYYLFTFIFAHFGVLATSYAGSERIKLLSGIEYTKLLSFPIIFVIFFVIILNLLFAVIAFYYKLRIFLIRKFHYISKSSNLLVMPLRPYLLEKLVYMLAAYKLGTFGYLMHCFAIITYTSFLISFILKQYNNYYDYFLGLADYFGVVTASMDMILFGIIAFYYKTIHSGIYGTIEVFFGALLCITALSDLINLSIVKYINFLPIFAGIYVIVRGLDNINKSRPQYLKFICNHLKFW